MKTSKIKSRKAKPRKGKSGDPRVARRAALAQVMQMGEGIVTPNDDVTIPEAEVDMLEQTVETAYVEATVGKLLETARQKRKVGKRELSRKLGTNHARISQLEGAENLELKSIVQVLDSLNYDLELHLVSRTDGNVIRARV